VRAIHQFVAGFANGDAISNEARVLAGIFGSWGCPSDIYCEKHRTLPELRRQICDIGEARASVSRDDVVVLHLSIGSVVNDVFASLPCRKAIIYHNVTPPSWFSFVNRQTAVLLEKGLKQVAALADAAPVCMADSAFNAKELEGMGYRNVKVLPLVLDFDKLGAMDRRVLGCYRDGRHNILFVGRCVPNKRIEDLVTAFFHYHQWVEPASRLIIAGSYAGAERYYHLLVTKVRELGLTDVHFVGSVPQAQLNAYYGSASLFLCMSEHEGFCIPLMESLYHSVPVMAYAAAAVPETLAGCGILFHEKRYDMIAEMMGHVCRDARLRESLLKKQADRLRAYRTRDLAGELRSHLAPLLT